jgi:hypothetical protein
MSINEIMDGVKRTGYQSNATNFRGVISMSLSNNQMFEKTGRGVYTLRPGALLTSDDGMEEEDELELESTEESSDQVQHVGANDGSDT